MNTVNVTATSRTDTGKKATKAVRNSGGIPCVMYGGKEVVHFTTTHNAVKSLIYTPDFKVAEIDMDGSKKRAIVKTAQFHPVTEKIMHIDFLRLIDGTPVNLELPVKFEGSSPGVKLGGKLQQSLRRIKVKTTPEKMVDVLTLNVSKLELGDAIRVRDLEVPEGIQIMVAPATPVAAVEIPRALRSAGAAEDGEKGDAAEGEGDAAEAAEA